MKNDKVIKISDAQAAKMCKKLIDKAVKGGVVLRPNSYLTYQHRTNFACALGSIEHAIARGRVTFNGHDNLARKMNHGISPDQLGMLETGFEGYTPRATNPLKVLGRKLREKALAVLKKRFPDIYKLTY